MADAPCRIHPCGFPRQRQYADHSHALCHVVFGEKRQHGGGAPTANVSPLPSMKTMKKKDKETPVSEVVWEGVVQPLHWAQTRAVTWAATFNSEVFLLQCWLCHPGCSGFSLVSELSLQHHAWEWRRCPFQHQTSVVTLEKKWGGNWWVAEEPTLQGLMVTVPLLERARHDDSLMVQRPVSSCWNPQPQRWCSCIE